MGGMPAKMMSSMVSVEKCTMVEIPDFWTMEEAATIPGLYMTIVYALLLVRNFVFSFSLYLNSLFGL